MIRRFMLVVVASVLCWLVLPSAAHAQSAIAGVVRDSSGAVAAGCYGRGASPALIEKSRSVVTDSQGQYRVSTCGLASTR